MWIEGAAAVGATASAHAPEARRRPAGRVGATIVAGDDLDILVPVAAVQLVLDAEVRELHAAVAVGQIVLMRPVRNFPVHAIRPSVAVGPSAVVLLEKLLVLASQ